MKYGCPPPIGSITIESCVVPPDTERLTANAPPAERYGDGSVRPVPTQRDPAASNARPWLKYRDCGVRTRAGDGEPVAVNWLAVNPRIVSLLLVVTQRVPVLSNLRS